MLEYEIKLDRHRRGRAFSERQIYGQLDNTIKDIVFVWCARVCVLHRDGFGPLEMAIDDALCCGIKSDAYAHKFVQP